MRAAAAPPHLSRMVLSELKRVRKILRSYPMVQERERTGLFHESPSRPCFQHGVFRGHFPPWPKAFSFRTEGGVGVAARNG